MVSIPKTFGWRITRMVSIPSEIKSQVGPAVLSGSQTLKRTRSTLRSSNASNRLTLAPLGERARVRGFTHKTLNKVMDWFELVEILALRGLRPGWAAQNPTPYTELASSLISTYSPCNASKNTPQPPQFLKLTTFFIRPSKLKNDHQNQLNREPST